MLELDEQVTIKMTREQAAAMVIAMSMAEDLPKAIGVLADQAAAIVQGCGAPIGVISRVLAKHQTPG